MHLLKVLSFLACHVVNPSFLESCKENEEINQFLQEQHQIMGLEFYICHPKHHFIRYKRDKYLVIANTFESATDKKRQRPTRQCSLFLDSEHCDE